MSAIDHLKEIMELPPSEFSSEHAVYEKNAMLRLKSLKSLTKKISKSAEELADMSVWISLHLADVNREIAAMEESISNRSVYDAVYEHHQKHDTWKE